MNGRVGEIVRILIGVRTSCLHLSTLNNTEQNGIVGRPASSVRFALSHRILCFVTARRTPRTRKPH